VSVIWAVALKELRQVRRAQQMADIGESSLGQTAQRLALDHHNVFAQHLFDPHTIARDLAIGGRILVGLE